MWKSVKKKKSHEISEKRTETEKKRGKKESLAGKKEGGEKFWLKEKSQAGEEGPLAGGAHPSRKALCPHEAVQELRGGGKSA